MHLSIYIDIEAWFFLLKRSVLDMASKHVVRRHLVLVTALKKRKENAGDFKYTISPDFVIPHGLSTLYRCSLTTLTQDKLYHVIPLIRDCCNHKGSCTLFRPYLTIAAGISSSSFVRVSTRQWWIPCLMEFQADSIFMQGCQFSCNCRNSCNLIDFPAVPCILHN